MGLLDKVKQQVTDVATTVAEKTQETAKVGQLQVQLRNLRNEERDAFAELGREAYRLQQAGLLAEGSTDLTASSTRIADVQARIVEKEGEIAAARGSDAGEPEGTVESSAIEVDDSMTASTPGSASGVTPETPPAAGTTTDDRAEGPAV